MDHRHYDIDTHPTVNPEVLEHKKIYFPIAPVHTTPWQTEYTANYRWPTIRIARDNWEFSERYPAAKNERETKDKYERREGRRERAVDEAVQTKTQRVRDDGVQTTSNDEVQRPAVHTVSVGTESERIIEEEPHDKHEPVAQPPRPTSAIFDRELTITPPAGVPSYQDDYRRRQSERHSFLSYGWAHETPHNPSTNMKTFNVAQVKPDQVVPATLEHVHLKESTEPASSRRRRDLLNRYLRARSETHYHYNTDERFVSEYGRQYRNFWPKQRHSEPPRHHDTRRIRGNEPAPRVLQPTGPNRYDATAFSPQFGREKMKTRATSPIRTMTPSVESRGRSLTKRSVRTEERSTSIRPESFQMAQELLERAKRHQESVGTQTKPN